jgi:putative transposase
MVRGRHRQKVSAMAALTLSHRRKLGLLFRTLQDRYFQTPDVVSFLEDLLKHIRGKIIIVWDRWNVHNSAARKVISPRLEYVKLPPYAAELNPVEQLWSRLKWSDFANFAPEDAKAMRKALKPKLVQKARCSSTLESFWKGAKLHIPRLKLKR